MPTRSPNADPENVAAGVNLEGNYWNVVNWRTVP